MAVIKNKASRGKGRRNFVEARMVRNIDALAAFEQYATEILPALRGDVKSGKGAMDLAKKYSALAMARLITTMAVELDNAKAASAAKDILDRAEGKPKEQKHITHQMAEMKDEELDAMIKSLRTQVGSDENV